MVCAKDKKIKDKDSIKAYLIFHYNNLESLVIKIKKILSLSKFYYTPFIFSLSLNLTGIRNCVMKAVYHMVALV